MIGIFDRIKDGEYGLAVALIVFTSFILAGSYMIYLGVEQYYIDEEMEEWTTTSGTIIVTEVRTEHYSGKGAHYEYYPDIEYYYSAGNEVYYGQATAPIDGYYQSYSGHLI